MFVNEPNLVRRSGVLGPGEEHFFNMKRIHVMVALVLAMVSTWLWAEGAPKIQFDQTSFDFGKSSEGETINGKFTFQNTGDGILKIGTPDPSCGCTVATVKPDTLKPGEKGELVFTLDLANARGPIEKLIVVPSTDPQHTNVNLTIKGESKAIYEVREQMGAFRAIPPGDTARKTIRIKRIDGQKLLMEKAEVSKEFLTVTMEREDRKS